ncbi:hypothetical protein D9M68_856980 [compost metagenome]
MEISFLQAWWQVADVSELIPFFFEGCDHSSGHHVRRAKGEVRFEGQAFLIIVVASSGGRVSDHSDDWMIEEVACPETAHGSLFVNGYVEGEV